MKIIQLIQKPQLRGAEIFACQLSHELNKQGHESIIVTVFNGEADLPFKGRVLSLHGSPSNRMWDWRAWTRLKEIIIRERPDIVQANSGDTLKYAVFSKMFFGWHVPIVHRNASRIGYFIDSKLKLIFNRFLIKRVDRVISVSEVSRKDFMKTFPFKKDKVTTIEIGIELKEIGPVPSDLQHIFNAGPAIVHVGALEVEKNHEGLMRIFKSLKSTLLNLQLIIVGSGSLRDTLKEYAEHLGIDESVHFIGRREDVLEIVTASQAFLLPSLIEGLPAVILESMYCRTPVIAYNVGGIGEVVQEDTGWLIEKNDENMFVKATMEVLTDPNKVQPRIVQAYQKITRYFNNSMIAKRFATVYAEIKQTK